LTENVAFLIDFDPNLMVCDMHSLAYAAVDNLLQKGNVWNGEQEEGKANGV